MLQKIETSTFYYGPGLEYIHRLLLCGTVRGHSLKMAKRESLYNYDQDHEPLREASILPLFVGTIINYW